MIHVHGLPLVLMSVLFLLLPASAEFHRGTTMNLPDDEEALCVGSELAEEVDAFELPRREFEERRSFFRHDDWTLIDSVEAQAHIPAGAVYAVRFDHLTRSLEEISPPDHLSATAKAALQRAPLWLREDLAGGLVRLGELQDLYADMVLAAQHPYIDEVAFQVAHVAPEMLSDSLFLTYPDLLADNAGLLYQIDQHLDYVEIVDYGEHADDYFSTTRYRTVFDEDTTWVEIPREYYYWFVVHPKISDEYVKQSDEPDDRQSTYGYFWREYLFYDPSAQHSYTAGGYPLLRDYLDSIRVFWDGNRHDLPFGRPLEPDDLALDALGNWATRVVPNAASGNRPIQPNQIVREHNGNCGELQDLLCAAARTALIPTLCTMDICEDHVWTEFYWDGTWHPYQVDLGGGGTHIDNPGIAYDCECGGGKEVSAIWDWRNDGYIWTVTGRYSDSCVLVCTVHDFNGQPVDGARVRLYSEAWVGGGNTTATWAYTDSDGLVRFVLGDHQNYYARVDCPVGSYPAESGAMVKIIDNSMAGQHYLKPFTVPGAISGFRAMGIPSPEDSLGAFRVAIQCEAIEEIVYGMNLYDGNTFAKRVVPGVIDFFICDSANYAVYSMADTVDTFFYAYEIGRDLASLFLTFTLPTDEDWYLVFSSDNRVVNQERVHLSVRLYEDQTSVELAADAGVPGRFLLEQNYPNPCNSATVIPYHLPIQRSTVSDRRAVPINLRVYNTAGQVVRTLVNGHQLPGYHRALWDGRDEGGEQVASGVYLCRLQVGNFREVRSMVLLK